jgi:cob(I)alamin adenosyltransferase
MSTTDRQNRRAYVQVYTGDGKGKTTAAVGLALRAAGAGLRVFIGQFLKGRAYSEIKALERFHEKITLEQFGTKRPIGKPMDEEDRAKAEAGRLRAEEVICGGAFDLVILDEVNVAAHYGLIEEQWILDMIEKRPAHVELVLTGRNAKPAVLSRADLVTEMRKVKHYFDSGVPARNGIEK